MSTYILKFGKLLRVGGFALMASIPSHGVRAGQASSPNTHKHVHHAQMCYVRSRARRLVSTLTPDEQLFLRWHIATEGRQCFRDDPDHPRIADLTVVYEELAKATRSPRMSRVMWSELEQEHRRVEDRDAGSGAL